MQNYLTAIMLLLLQLLPPKILNRCMLIMVIRMPLPEILTHLSYVSEPFKDLRILALDANEYYNNTPIYCVVAGKIKDATMEWAKKQLADAKAKGKTVIGMMHHGIIEHFMGESVIFPDYLVDNWGENADELMQAGLKVIFTGHFHANDATQRTAGNLSLVDIETGSPSNL
jgi:3',5'-cyclic AMP phosphodiesterase CpdA